MIAIVATILLEAGNKDMPVYIILPAAFLVPLAVLIIGALMRPRGGGH
jgi:hypothetical protein